MMSPLTPIWSNGEWTCMLAFPGWRPFLHDAASDLVEVVFITPEEIENAPPEPSQLAAVTSLSERQNELFATVHAAIRAHYDEVRPMYVSVLDTASLEMPENPDTRLFERLHGLQRLYVHPPLAGGVVCVGFSFSATWEVEHGLGVMVHGDRVVDVGEADTAFLT